MSTNFKNDLTTIKKYLSSAQNLRDPWRLAGLVSFHEASFDRGRFSSVFNFHEPSRHIIGTLHQAEGATEQQQEEEEQGLFSSIHWAAVVPPGQRIDVKDKSVRVRSKDWRGGDILPYLDQSYNNYVQLFRVNDHHHRIVTTYYLLAPFRNCRFYSERCFKSIFEGGGGGKYRCQLGSVYSFKR